MIILSKLWLTQRLVVFVVGSQNVHMTEEEEEVDMESILCPAGKCNDISKLFNILFPLLNYISLNDKLIPYF